MRAHVDIHGLAEHDYESIDWEEHTRPTTSTRWKQNKDRTVILFPQHHHVNRKIVKISLHPEEMEVYEFFLGEEDGLDEFQWKTIKTDNLEITMYKP